MRENYTSKALMFFGLFALSFGSTAQTSTFSTPGTTAWTMPAGVTGLNVDMQGGNGGRATGTNTGVGGMGGRVRCILAVTTGEVLNIVVGGKGDTGVLGTSSPGGYNNTVATGGHCSSLPNWAGGGGGGSSEICSGGTALSDRLVVAGGGGGGGSNNVDETGGAGGGLTGGNGVAEAGDFAGTGGGPASGGLGGSYASYGTSDPGTARFGGKASTFPSSVDGSAGGGGGGGWYGGGGGSWGAGGGGSSYTDPVRASSVIHAQGYNTTGDGSVKVTLICETPLAGTITGAAAICAGGGTLTLANATGSAYGTWSSSNTAVALVNATTGAVTSGVAGSATISFTATTACGTSASATVTLNVTPLPDAGTITGTNNVCPGVTVTLENATSGGTWSSSNTSLASVNAGTGEVAGIAAGAVTISYNVTISGCSSSATYPFTVNSAAICNDGIKNLAGKVTALSVFPNPGTGVFSVALESPANIVTRFVVTNSLGEKVKEILSATNIPVSMKLNAPAGVYFLSAENAYGKWTGKMTVIK